MSTKYKFTDKAATYFTTSTIVGWIDVFTRDLYRDILLNSFRYCQKNQGLQMHAWVLMTNHFHLIYSCTPDYDPVMVLKNIKSYTALKILYLHSLPQCVLCGEGSVSKSTTLTSVKKVTARCSPKIL